MSEGGAVSRIVNASPIILLAKGGYLDLLRAGAEHVLVPTVVVDEIQNYPSADPAVEAVGKTKWLQVVEPPAAPGDIKAWDLGPGESAVLSWAMANPGTEAILDDLPARRCAASLGVPVRGTLGLVLLATKRGIIPLARPVVEQLKSAGMYLSDRAANDALRLVGE